MCSLTVAEDSAHVDQQRASVSSIDEVRHDERVAIIRVGRDFTQLKQKG